MPRPPIGPQVTFNVYAHQHRYLADRCQQEHLSRPVLLRNLIQQEIHRTNPSDDATHVQATVAIPDDLLDFVDLFDSPGEALLECLRICSRAHVARLLDDGVGGKGARRGRAKYPWGS